MSERSRSPRNQTFLDTSFLYGGNARYLEDMAAAYARDPSSVPAEWRDFFAEVGDEAAEAGHAARGPSWGKGRIGRADEFGEALGVIDGSVTPSLIEKVAERHEGASAEDIRKATQDSIRAIMMIRAYRMRGHLAADLDPLNLTTFGEQPELDPETYGFTAADMDRAVKTIAGSARSMGIIVEGV